jgi:hypothetical protein
MKTKILLVATLLAGVFTISFAQENELPPTGNVGIGTSQPTEKLDVRGAARIDSTLRIGDSLTVQNSARVGEDLIVTGNTYLKSDIFVTGDIHLNAATTEDEILLVGTDGILKKGGGLQAAMYHQNVQVQDFCRDGNSGYTTPANPIWLNSPGKIYASRDCVPDVKVGIGNSNPQAKLHITLNNNAVGVNTHALLVQRSNGDKILQLTEDGLLQAREIKVDVASWPDYVFDGNYVLMPLDEVAAYIEQFEHLPGVPSACEMEQEGMNITQTNVLLLEKIEELTLYMIELQNQLKTQQEKINTMEQTIIQK